MSDKPGSQGNGCLYLVGAFGVFCVLLGAAWNHIDFADDEPDVTQRGLDLPPPPPPSPVVEPEPEPPPSVVEPAPIIASEGLETEPIVWHAEVLYHRELGEGLDCAVVLGMNRRLDGPSAVHATVACANRVLFDGLVGRQAVSELSLGDRGFAYRANVSAMGRDEWERHSLTFDSGSRRVAITLPGQTVELYVDDLSVPRRGDAFFVSNETNPPRAFAPIRRAAHVDVVDGPVPAGITRARSGCQLSVRPAMSSSFNCRVVLRCGAAVIYGAGTSGYNACQLANGTVWSARDEGTSVVDTDPDIDLDIAGGRMTVIDDGPDGRWQATFELSNDPSCETSTLYEGPVVGTADRMSVERTGDTWGVTLPGLVPVSYVARPTEPCETGDLVLDGEAGSLHLSRGIDGRTLAGTWVGVDGPTRAVLVERVVR